MSGTRERFKLPGDDSRVLILGATGTGKTQNGLDHLSRRSIDEKVWIAMSFKGAGMMEKIPVTDCIEIDDPLPDAPGLYYMKAPFSSSRGDHPTSEFFAAVRDRGNIGIFIDETQGVGHDNKGFQTLCFAGRELNVPMIMCAQEPTAIDPMARRQASIIQCFRLGSKLDRMNVDAVTEEGVADHAATLPPYHSVWYDKTTGRRLVRPPCDDFDTITNRIFERMAPPPGNEPQLEEEVIPPPTLRRKRVKI